MEVRCECSAVVFRTPTPQPLALYICHCSDCRRQAGSAFGSSAIFPKFELPEDSKLSCYSRLTASGQVMLCYFCKGCGARLIHTTAGKNVVSIKAGCIEGVDWSKAIHLWTKSAMVPIPEGCETHSEDSSESSDYDGLVS